MITTSKTQVSAGSVLMQLTSPAADVVLGQLDCITPKCEVSPVAAGCRQRVNHAGGQNDPERGACGHCHTTLSSPQDMSSCEKEKKRFRVEIFSKIHLSLLRKIEVGIIIVHHRPGRPPAPETAANFQQALRPPHPSCLCPPLSPPSELGL